MKRITRFLSFLLAASMLLGMLPSAALAADWKADTLSEPQFGSEYTITKDGIPISADGVIALIENGASLDEVILVDGVAVTLGDFQKMLEIEREIDRLDKTYFSQDGDLTPEQQAALQSLYLQLLTTGVPLRGGSVSLPSGYEEAAVLTVSADPVPNGSDTAAVTYTLNQALAYDVTFSVRTVDGSAKAGVNYTKVNRNYTISAGETSVVVTVPILNAASWSGHKIFLVEAYDIRGAQMDGALRGSCPVVITSTKNYATPGFTSDVTSICMFYYPDANTAGLTIMTKTLTAGLSDLQKQALRDGIISHVDITVSASQFAPSAGTANVYPLGFSYIKVALRTTATGSSGTEVLYKGFAPNYVSLGGAGGSSDWQMGGEVYFEDTSSTNLPFPVSAGDVDTAWISIAPIKNSVEDHGDNNYGLAYVGGTFPRSHLWNIVDAYADVPVTVHFLDLKNPTITGVTWDKSYHYGIGSIMPVTVTFHEPVTPETAYIVMNGQTYHPLETAGPCNALTFAYQVPAPTGSAPQDTVTVSEIGGAKDLAGNQMETDTTNRVIGDGASHIVYTAADAARAGSFASDKGVYRVGDEAATFVLTLPDTKPLLDAVRSAWSDLVGDPCPHIYLSIDGGTTRTNLFADGDETLTGLKAVLALDSLEEGQTYAAELFSADGALIPGVYTVFSRAEAVPLTKADFSIQTPDGFPTQGVYADTLPGEDALKLRISVAGGGFTWADTAKVTAYDADGVLPDGDFDFAWCSESPGVATIDAAGQIHLTGASGTAAFTLTALNGGRSLVVSDAVTVTVLPGNFPFLNIPASSRTVIGRAHQEVRVYWTSNLTEKNDEISAGHVTLFTVSVYRADAGGAKTGEPVATVVVSSRKEKPVSSATLLGLDEISIGNSPSYVAEIQADALSGVVGGARSFTAEAAIVIRAQPAVASLTRPTALSITDKITPVTVPWTIENFDQTNQTAFKLTVTDNATGEKLVDLQSTDTNHGTVQFPISGGAFRNMYTAELWAKNADDPTWSYDSFVLTVYAESTLQILLDGTVAGDSAKLSNRDWISGLTQEEILALARDIPLEKRVSIDSDGRAWSEIRDRIVWSVDNTESALLSTKQGSFHEDIESLPYTSYAPAANFVLSGLTNGSATLKAAHAALGDDLSDSVSLQVETLQDHLYLFNFYPAAVTTISYNNGKTAVSDANGQAAIYAEDGISGTIYVQSEYIGSLYVGSISAQSLDSGEKPVTSLELYPVNNFKLHEAASVPLRFVGSDGQPMTGNIAIRGGVYRNGEYCPDAIIDNQIPGTGVTADYIITPDSSGSYNFRFDIDTFLTEHFRTPVTAQDKITFLFEVRAEGHYPLLLTVDGTLNARAAIRTGMRVVTMESMPASAAGKPFVTSQTLHYGTTAQGSGTNVWGAKAKVGPSDAVPDAVLKTVAMWPNTETTDISKYQMQIVNTTGLLAPVQSSSATRYPFSTITVVESLLPLNKTSMERWGLSNPFSTQQVNLRYTKGGTVVKNEQTNLRAVNMVGYDPTKSRDLELLTDDVVSVFMKSTSNGLNLDGGFLSLGMQLVSSVKINLPFLKAQLAPTADPTVFRALIFAGVDKLKEEGDQKFSFTPGLSDLKSIDKDIGGYLDESEAAIKKAFDSLKSQANGQKGGATAGDKDVKFALTGYVEAEIYYDYDANRWECDFLNGDFTAGGGIGYEWTHNTVVGPVPVVAQFGLGASLQLNVKIAADKIADRTDFLTTVRIQAYFRAFGGIGFDYAIVALKIGLYGQLNFDAQLRWLSQLHGDTTYTYNIAIDGEVGIMFAAKLMFFSYEKTLWSKKIPIADWKRDNWDDVEAYWKTVSSGRSGNQYSILSGPVRMLAYDQTTGTALYESPSTARLERRDYLDLHARTWNSGGIRLFSLDEPNGAPASLQTNAYPYADPQLSDDGSLLLYLTDQNVADISKTRAAFSVRSVSGYQEGTVIDDAGYGDSQLSVAGTSSFAAAAWTRLSEDSVRKEPGNQITSDEQAMMLNATEIMAAVYTGGAWQTTALTSNTTADMAPVAVTNGDKAMVLWRSVAGTNNEDLLNFNAKDRIYYRVYEGGAWGETETLYNGTSGAVKAIDAVMASDGTTAVTYTIKSGTDDMVTTDLDIVYAVIDATGTVVRNVRLTADTFTNENPQVTAVKLAESDEHESFVLGWHSMQDADGVSKHDIRLAAFDRDGNLLPGFVDSLSDLTRNTLTNLTADFAFARNAGTIDRLSIAWRGPALDYMDDSTAEHDVLFALRFVTTDSGAISATAAQRLAEMSPGTSIDSFDLYVAPGGEMKAILLGTTYDFSSLIQDGTVIGSDGEESGIYLPDEVAGLYTATMTYTDTIRVDSVIPDFLAIYRGGLLPIQFSVTNLGTAPIEALDITIGTQADLLGAAPLTPIAPGENRTVIVNYRVPGTALTDPDYTITARFASDAEAGASGTVALNIPDVGISVLELQNAQDGDRYLRLGVYNESDSALYESGRSVILGLYADAACTIPVGDAYCSPVTVTGEELRLMDEATYVTQLIFDLEGYVRAAGNEDYLNDAGEIRPEGVTVYAKATVVGQNQSGEPVEIAEYLTQNNTRYIVFGSLLDAADGEAVSITTTMDAAETQTDVTVALQNNSLNGVTSGNVIVFLLDATGKLIAQTQIYGGTAASLLTLDPEEKTTLTFSFPHAGASVAVSYSQTVLADDEAGLATLSASEIPISLSDFVYDETRDLYAAEVSVSGMQSTVITAVAKSVGAQVSIGDETELTNSMSARIELRPGTKTVVPIRSVAADTTTVCNYELTIEVAKDQTDVPASGSGYDNSASPRAAVFDLYPQSAYHTDVVITLSSSYTVRSVTLDGIPLTAGTDYTVDGNKYRFKTEFLKTCAVGTHSLAFLMSGGANPAVTLTVTNTNPATSWTNPFMDVLPTDWFCDAVRYAVENGLFCGTSDTAFSPNTDMTRAMLGTVLYRLAGEPAVTGTNPFTDVALGEWYTDAVLWAAENGIVSGYGNGRFGTEDAVTREQLAVILHRYAKDMGYDTAKTTALTRFADAASISVWAGEAMRWAVAEELILGTPEETLVPGGKASRAQTATILMRFLENIAK